MKVCINGPGHMTKMAAMAINRKTLLNSSSPEPEGLYFKTWHEASANGALQRSTKVAYAFEWGKNVKMGKT